MEGSPIHSLLPHPCRQISRSAQALASGVEAPLGSEGDNLLSLYDASLVLEPSSFPALQAPLLAYNNFVEAVFAFNNKSSKPEADAFAGTSDEEREAFVLAGSATNSRVARRVRIAAL